MTADQLDAAPPFGDARSTWTVERALAAIDHANSADPNRVDGEPRARIEGRRASAWLDRLEAAPSDALAIAARAHHLRRWEVPRADYPSGRAGYLRWRRDNKAHQAASCTELLIGLDGDLALTDRVAELLLRGSLGSDHETQRLEDVACLAFLQTQLDAIAGRLDADHLAAIIAKTKKKMSAEAIELIAEATA